MTFNKKDSASDVSTTKVVVTGKHFPAVFTSNLPSLMLMPVRTSPAGRHDFMMLHSVYIPIDFTMCMRKYLELWVKVIYIHLILNEEQ
jgi:hypothetical protein